MEEQKVPSGVLGDKPHMNSTSFKWVLVLLSSYVLLKLEKRFSGRDFYSPFFHTHIFHIVQNQCP
ncbi:hypothetical protein QJS10_CPA03g02045 [Acorus calamus]|uniref:Uncharacterized protein n=1 Tax=Acorus calamus TaxID=4465 RepID=A0AAV9F3G1_ACOCL|nr:hypothetical protein QJS10_CPA03g02045 [Acorus calamus]